MVNYGFFSDLAIGAVVGAGSQLAENYDAKKEVEFAATGANASKKFSEFKKIGTYVSFGIPAIGIIANFVNLPIPSKWSDKAVAVGSVLAGQKIVQMLTKKNYHLVYNAASNYYTGIAPSLYSGARRYDQIPSGTGRSFVPPGVKQGPGVTGITEEVVERRGM